MLSAGLCWRSSIYIHSYNCYRRRYPGFRYGGSPVLFRQRDQVWHIVFQFFVVFYKTKEAAVDEGGQYACHVIKRFQMFFYRIFLCQKHGIVSGFPYFLQYRGRLVQDLDRML